MHAALLDEAHRAIETKLPGRGSDYRLGYHLAPPAGWMNDPNGLVFFAVNIMCSISIIPIRRSGDRCTGGTPRAATWCIGNICP